MQQPLVILDLCLRKTWSRRSHMVIVTPSFSGTLRFQNVFRPHENEKPPFSDSCGLKSVTEKLRFRDGLKNKDEFVGLDVDAA